jgi:hypothetical protein
MTPRLTPATGIELAQHCAFPWTSGIAAPARRPDSPARRYGRAFRAMAADLALYVPGERDCAREVAERHHLADEEVERLQATQAQVIELLAADGAELHANLGMAWSPLSGRARPCEKPWETEEQEFYGRADLVLKNASELRVRQWKSRIPGRTRRPGEMPQLRFLALAASSLFYVQRVTVETAHVDEDGFEITSDSLSRGELNRIEGEVIDVAFRVRSPEAAELRPGPWCARLHCPIQAVCPATRAALARVHEDLDRWPLLGEPQSPEHAAWQRHRLPVLRAALDEQEGKLEDFARRTPIPVDGKPGIVWGAVEKHGNEKLDLTPEAERLVMERLGPEGAEKAIERSASKASLERGAKVVVAAQHEGKVPRGAVPALLEPLLNELRQAKVLRRGGKFTRFEEFKRPDGEDEPLQIEAPEDEPMDDFAAEW